MSGAKGLGGKTDGRFRLLGDSPVRDSGPRGRVESVRVKIDASVAGAMFSFSFAPQPSSGTSGNVVMGSAAARMAALSSCGGASSALVSGGIEPCVARLDVTRLKIAPLVGGRSSACEAPRRAAASPSSFGSYAAAADTRTDSGICVSNEPSTACVIFSSPS